MNAVYTGAVRYSVTARCMTPLRTGGGDTETVLRYGNGQAFIQGSSLAGSMRAWLEQQGETDTAARLFGSRAHGGRTPGSRLMVSDGVFPADADMKIRPRVKIDGKTGAAEGQKKFDIAHIGRGATFNFTLTLLEDPEEPEAADSVSAVEQMLSAMNSGEIRLGAQKSNGFGLLSLSVKKTVYHLRNEQDRNAWLEDIDPYPAGETPFRFPKLPGFPIVVFTVRGRADSILVKSSYTEQREKAQADNILKKIQKGETIKKRIIKKEIYSVTLNLNEQDCPILPGSAVKGALRSRVTAIAGFLNADRARETVNELFGRGPEETDNGIPGKVRCADVLLPREKGNRKEIARVRLDRFTGGVIRQGLFWEEPVSGGITLQYTVPADQPVGCALVLYALRDLGLKLWNVGSGGSIGRGFLHVSEIEAAAPDGRRLYLWDFYQREADGTEGGLLTGKWSMEDSGGLWTEWNSALEEWRETHES